MLQKSVSRLSLASASIGSLTSMDPHYGMLLLMKEIVGKFMKWRH